MQTKWYLKRKEQKLPVRHKLAQQLLKMWQGRVFEDSSGIYFWGWRLGIGDWLISKLMSRITILLVFVAWMCAIWQPAEAQQSGISQPATGETVSGIVEVIGTAADPAYLRYELAFLQEANPGAGWIVFAEGNQQVVDGTLAFWDTTVGRNIGSPVFPDGVYQLRLRVVRADYNYSEYFVTGLVVANETPITPTPEDTPETAESAPVPTLPVTAVFQQPDILPSLTPFPTPTPPATPINAPLGPETVAETAETSGGLLGQLETIDTNQFGQAFWRGVTVPFYIFAAIAIYLVVRTIARWLWQLIWGRIIRNDKQK